MGRFPILLTYVLSLLTTATSLSVKATVDKFFSYPIKFDSFSQAGEHVLLDSFQSGSAVLPDWLHLRHTPETATAYLYGTPVEETQGKINVQIVGLDTESYHTRTENIIIELYDNPAELLYFVELPLLNASLGDLLQDDNLSKLTVIMRRLWTRGEVMITKVISPSLHSRLTVIFGGSKHFSTQLRLLSTHPISPSCQNNEHPSVGVEKNFLPRFQIDWCRVVLTDMSMNPTRVSDMCAELTPLHVHLIPIEITL